MKKLPHVQHAPDAPFWLPTGDFWENLSPGVKQAVAEILTPAYQRLVLGARERTGTLRRPQPRPPPLARDLRF